MNKNLKGCNENNDSNKIVLEDGTKEMANIETEKCEKEKAFNVTKPIQGKWQLVESLSKEQAEDIITNKNIDVLVIESKLDSQIAEMLYEAGIVFYTGLKESKAESLFTFSGHTSKDDNEALIQCEKGEGVIPVTEPKKKMTKKFERIYNNDGRLIYKKNLKTGEFKSIDYDDSGRITRIKTEKGVTTKEYDSEGRILKECSSTNSIKYTSYSTDVEGNLVIKTKHKKGKVVTKVKDKDNGNLLKKIIEHNNKDNKLERYRYNEEGDTVYHSVLVKDKIVFLDETTNVEAGVMRHIIRSNTHRYYIYNHANVLIKTIKETDRKKETTTIEYK